MSTPEPWFILADVASHPQGSEGTSLRSIAKRRLPAHCGGRMWRFRLTEADGWVRAGGELVPDDQGHGRLLVAMNRLPRAPWTTRSTSSGLVDGGRHEAASGIPAQFSGRMSPVVRTTVRSSHHG
jgi:hypothetical protein